MCFYYFLANLFLFLFPARSLPGLLPVYEDQVRILLTGNQVRDVQANRLPSLSFQGKKEKKDYSKTMFIKRVVNAFLRYRISS